MECQIHAIRIPADVESNAIDPSRRTAEESDLIDRWHLGRQAKGAKGGPPCRTRPTMSGDLERHIDGTRTGLAEPALVAPEIQALVGAHDRGVGGDQARKGVLNRMPGPATLGEIRNAQKCPWLRAIDSSLDDG